MKEYARKVSRLALVFALVLGLLPVQIQPAQAVVTQKVVISQVYGGGGNSGGVYAYDFIELFNAGLVPAPLDGWSVQYGSTTGNIGGGDTAITPLSGTLAPGQYLLVQEAVGTNTSLPALPQPYLIDSTPIGMSGSGGKVALVNTTTGLGCGSTTNTCSDDKKATIVDLVGWGSAGWYEGTAPAVATGNGTAALRQGGGCTDTNDNSADFTNPAIAPAPRTSASPYLICGSPVGTGVSKPNALLAGYPTLLAVTVTPGVNPASTGLGVDCDLSPIGGPASKALVDDGQSGDVAAGDNIFSYTATIQNTTTSGPKSLACTIHDAESRSSSVTIALTVTDLLSIGAVNGPVLDTDNGATHASAYNGKTVSVQGVIYEKTLQAIKGSTDAYYGFYIQNTAAAADGDPNTSDGLFVYMNRNSTMPGTDVASYTPAVGDEVVITGAVTEYYNMTEMTDPLLTGPVVRHDVVIDDEVPARAANPPANGDSANRYWERLQGMRVQVPANSIVISGRGVFSPADAETWLAAPDSTIASRTDPYQRRAFRDSHPLDDNYDPANWDGNGYRIVIGSLGIKGAAGDAQALLNPSRTFDTLTDTPANKPAGGLNYTYSKYRIEVTTQPEYTPGADPALNNPPPDFNRSAAYSIVDYNLENLYDFRDNPFSGCDFDGNPGCAATGTPFLSSVNPPYDYVPASDDVYQDRLEDIALQITGPLHNPDILMVQEVENQDICTVTAGALTCGATDNADDKPDVLQELALKITSLGGPTYEAAFDRDSSDLRGIAPAFLYRTDRVERLPYAGDPVLGADPKASLSPVFDYAGATVPGNANTSNPKTLNAVLPSTFKSGDKCETSLVFPRAADVALFRIYSTSINVGDQQDVYIINNHFKSSPDGCVAHRMEQAKFNAALIKFIQTAKPGARVVMGGDLNVYPRPDDTTPATDQLASLYDSSLGLKNLMEVLVKQAPESAYSYVYLGQAQTIDQMFINQAQLMSLQTYRVAHVNSDFSAEYPGDVARGTSDHDPNMAVFNFKDRTQLSVDSGGPYTVASGSSVTLTAVGTDPDGGNPSYAWDLDNNGTFETPGNAISFSAAAIAAPTTYPVKVQMTTGIGLTAVAETTITVTNQAPLLAAPLSKNIPENASYTFTASATDPNVPPQSLTFSLVNPPVANAALKSQTGEFAWTPTEDQGGAPYTFTIQVSDGYATAEQTFTLTVDKINQAPVFADLADQSVTAPAKLSFTISATDADLPAQTLTYAVKQGTLPTGATFDAAKGTFTWTPTYHQAGAHDVTFTVSDGIAPAVEMTITITVDKGSLLMLPTIANH